MKIKTQFKDWSDAHRLKQEVDVIYGSSYSLLYSTRSR